jgi:hypothetical protein
MEGKTVDMKMMLKARQSPDIATLKETFIQANQVNR